MQAWVSKFNEYLPPPPSIGGPGVCHERRQKAWIISLREKNVKVREYIWTLII